MRGASPAGCRLRRSTFTGDCNSSAQRRQVAARRICWRRACSNAGRSPAPGTARALASTARLLLRGAQCGSSSGRSGKTGAKPPATSNRLRSRSGTSAARPAAAASHGSAARGRFPESSNVWSISRLLRANSSWLRRRRCRHSRSSAPTGRTFPVLSMAACYHMLKRDFHYLTGN